MNFEEELIKKLKELRDWYYQNYPNGDYLDINFSKRVLSVNNRYYDADEEHKINRFLRIEEEEE